ncbi:putative major facilitator, sugar transporter, major facilitator superfamily [Lupinus albus]|uniref:Putative major facilitator, sugar transporter, major facilitator superfamily n=1 Tax=Lupinus albus TaxID=3870 RepID=A0A6A4PE33_LUPAL|nr:putative major facilitator, sugar transporter, major facilitator superfamily [Lupinus albus]
MGLVGMQGNENGNGEISEIPLGAKTKYIRMNSDLTETEEGLPINNPETRKFVFVCAIFASLNSVLLGYDVGVMSGAIIFIQEDLKITEVQQEVLIGILSIISLLGSLAAGKTSDAIGRKWTIGLAAVIFQTGGAIMALAPSFKVLMIGRLLAGVGIGFGVMIAPVYIAEISPAIARGSLTSVPEIFINFGILLGYISNYAFSKLPAHINWRIMLGVGLIPSVVIAVALFAIPESPRWLVVQNRIEEARLVLIKITNSEKEAEEKLQEIQIAAGSANADKYETKAVWLEILRPSPAVRRMLITGCGIQCFQQITGIDTTVYYSPQIFKNAGITGNSQLLAATVAVGFTKTLFILIAILFIDKLGRKPLLYASTIGMTVCLFSLSLSLAFLSHAKAGIILAIIAVCGNVASFSVGLGPICWVLSSEIFPLRLRAQASALGAVGSRVSSGVISMSFLSVTRAITTSGTFFIFGLISCSAIAFVHYCVPETKGKSLEDIEVLFQNEGELQGNEVEMGDVEHLMQKS